MTLHVTLSRSLSLSLFSRDYHSLPPLPDRSHSHVMKTHEMDHELGSMGERGFDHIIVKKLLLHHSLHTLVSFFRSLTNRFVRSAFGIVPKKEFMWRRNFYGNSRFSTVHLWLRCCCLYYSSIYMGIVRSIVCSLQYMNRNPRLSPCFPTNDFSAESMIIGRFPHLGERRPFQSTMYVCDREKEKWYCFCSLI